jgi:hypothetical protein
MIYRSYRSLERTAILVGHIVSLGLLPHGLRGLVEASAAIFAGAAANGLRR